MQTPAPEHGLCEEKGRAAAPAPAAPPTAQDVSLLGDQGSGGREPGEPERMVFSNSPVPLRWSVSTSQQMTPGSPFSSAVGKALWSTVQCEPAPERGQQERHGAQAHMEVMAAWPL